MTLPELIEYYSDNINKCNKECDGICSSISNGKCGCVNARTLGFLLELASYKKKEESNNNWILADKEKPCDCGEVFCTVKVKGFMSGLQLLWYNKELDIWCYPDDKPLEKGYEVVAWQYLPETYIENIEESNS